MLLAARRQYVLMPTPAVLFGCLSTVCLTEPLLHKDLRSIAIGQAGNPESDPVYLDRVPFGTHKIRHDRRCQAFVRISDGVFFNITEISTNPQNPHIVTVEQPTESEGLTDMPNGIYETNPWVEILRSSQNFYDTILDFADEWAKIDGIAEVYDWPEMESFHKELCTKSSALLRFAYQKLLPSRRQGAIASTFSRNGRQKSLNDFFLSLID